MTDSFFSLFVYGTLKEPSVVRALFGHELETRPAKLMNHRLVIGGDGYLSLQYLLGYVVDGLVLELDRKQLWLVDQWEEIPLYARKRGRVQVESGELEVFYYDRDLDSPQPAETSATSSHSLEKVVSAATRLRMQMMANEVAKAPDNA